MQPSNMTNEWVAYLDQRIKALALGQDDVRPIIEAVLKVVNEQVTMPLLKEIAELKRNAMNYCGIYSRALEYKRGAVTTCNGSLWFCIRDSVGSQPGDGDSDWQLITKGFQAAGQAQMPVKLNGVAPSNPKLRTIIGREGT